MNKQQVVTTINWFTVCGAAIGLILAIDSTSSGGELGKLTLQDKPLELLGGGVLMMMPQGAKVEPRKAANIMGADPSADAEGRIVLDAGSERLVLMAQETFQWADKNFREVLEKQYANCSITPMPQGKEEPKSYLFVPKQAPPVQAATGVASACLIPPDHTVVLLQAYANPEACQDLPSCTALAKEILSHATGANLPVKREAGTRRLRAIVKDKDLEVDLPQDHLVTFRRGPDFLVCYIRPLSPYGAVPATLVVYQGAHPSAFHKQSKGDGAKPPEVTPIDGTFLGRKTSWMRWTSGTGNPVRTHAETIVSFGDVQAFHVYFSAQTPQDMATCEKIAQSMALVDKQPAAAVKPAPNAERAAPGKDLSGP
ncbi:MAG: hypothetical protein NTU94_06100 [Planctomycetota bacterium]|nr:hypothetical protein [Planctomycetota bacterium]